MTILKFIRTLFLFLILTGCSTNNDQELSGTLIKGATLINPGTKTEIIKSSYIFFKANEIIAYGDLASTEVLPKAAKIIDATGKFIMPGLIDGFATLNNQAYANAYLYKGITTILEVDGGRRGSFYAQASPSPDIYRLEGIAEEPMATDKLISTIDSLHTAKIKVLLMMYSLTPEQTKIVYEHAKSLGMATIGEMARTTYKEGMEIGIDAFVHTTRYSLDVAPREMAEAIALEPFSNDLNSAKWQYYKYLTTLRNDDPALLEHAQNLAASNSYIMPTMSLSYLDLPEAHNPWADPVAAILNPEDINRPADPRTGKHAIKAEEQAAYTNLIANETSVIEPTYYRAGAKYLAGSATDVWGTMPGISLHTELMLLHTKPGLTIEEVLAATTVNFNKAFGWKVGKLKPGFEADILLLDQNPLQDLKNLNTIYKIYSNGIELDHQQLLINYKN
jgi:Amidohydrolase family